jgi:hypothetical protein
LLASIPKAPSKNVILLQPIWAAETCPGNNLMHKTITFPPQNSKSFYKNKKGRRFYTRGPFNFVIPAQAEIHTVVILSEAKNLS